MFHDGGAASAAEAAFKRIFQDQLIPEDMPEHHLKPNQSLVDVMVEAGLAPSRSQARRLIQQDGVKLDEAGVGDGDQPVALERPVVLRVGKRRFLRLIP